MKTDRQELEELFDRFGIVFREGEDYEVHPGLNAIVVETDSGPKNIGYMDFVAVFSFDEGGNFVHVGVWE